MYELQITRAENRDQPTLHRLWEAVFGDPPELVEAFFECFPPEAAGWVARRGDTICSAAYLLPGNWLLCGDRYQPMGYVYAVATDEAERGKGYAGALMRAMAAEADERGLLLYTRPAERTLFPWYAKTLGAAQTAAMREISISRDDSTEAAELRPLSPALYGARRETLLADRPHVLLSENLLRLQQFNSQAAGGGLFAVDQGCCACEKRDGALYLLETIGISDTRAAQTMMRHLGCDRAVVRAPGDDTPVAAHRGEPLPENTHWGLFLE